MNIRKILASCDKRYFGRQIFDKISSDGKTLTIEPCSSGNYPSIEVYRKSINICFPCNMNSSDVKENSKIICVYLTMILWGYYIPGDKSRGENGIVFRMMYKTYFSQTPHKNPIRIYLS